MLQAVLLPFKGQIVYDGFLLPYRIFFGAGIRRSLNDEYQAAKARYGIITSLPFMAEEDERSDADKLRFYLRSKRNREQYHEEIEALLDYTKNCPIFSGIDAALIYAASNWFQSYLDMMHFPEESPKFSNGTT